MSENPLEGLYDIDWAAFEYNVDIYGDIMTPSIPLLLEEIATDHWREDKYQSIDDGDPIDSISALFGLMANHEGVKYVATVALPFLLRLLTNNSVEDDAKLAIVTHLEGCVNKEDSDIAYVVSRGASNVSSDLFSAFGTNIGLFLKNLNHPLSQIRIRTAFILGFLMESIPSLCDEISIHLDIETDTNVRVNLIETMFSQRLPEREQILSCLREHMTTADEELPVRVAATLGVIRYSKNPVDDRLVDFVFENFNVYAAAIRPPMSSNHLAKIECAFEHHPYQYEKFLEKLLLVVESKHVRDIFRLIRKFINTGHYSISWFNNFTNYCLNSDRFDIRENLKDLYNFSDHPLIKSIKLQE
jgi:hypothetical protein